MSLGFRARVLGRLAAQKLPMHCPRNGLHSNSERLCEQLPGVLLGPRGYVLSRYGWDFRISGFGFRIECLGDKLR